MKLSLVILNYNSETSLERCLRSIRLSHPGSSPEIVLVDNGSHNRRTVRRICSNFGVDQVLENRSNLGVAAGRNQGVRASTGDLICTLDVDTVVTAGALDELAIATQGEAAGVCGPQLRFPDGELQFTCRRFRQSSPNCCG
jgi:GT2 family glycosyltransferase